MSQLWEPWSECAPGSLRGAEIVYCPSGRAQRVAIVADLLTRYGFGASILYYRAAGEDYGQLMEPVVLDLLIEDDCRSIGGRWQCCAASLSEHLLVVSWCANLGELPT